MTQVYQRCFSAVLASCLSVLLAASPQSSAAPLDLTLNQVTDISALGFAGVGGLAFNPGSGELWISDAATDTNDVALIDPLTGSSLLRFDASAGNVFLGPDAVAFDPTANELFLFSAFRDLTAGVTTAAGVALRSLTTDARQYAGAAFNASGELWVADRESFNLNPDFLRRLDPASGSQPASLEISGASFNPNLSGLVFDPVSGNPFAYDTDQQVLLEIDLGTGLVLSETAVGSFFSAFNVPGGIAFNSAGDQLYLGSGLPLGHPTGIVSELIVLNRFSAATIPLPAGVWLLIGGLGALSAGNDNALSLARPIAPILKLKF